KVPCSCIKLRVAIMDYKHTITLNGKIKWSICRLTETLAMCIINGTNLRTKSHLHWIDTTTCIRWSLCTSRCLVHKVLESHTSFFKSSRINVGDIITDNI